MAKRPDPSKSIAVLGEEYDVVPCSFCGGAAIILPDKRGRPYYRCQTCDARGFGSMASMELAKIAGRMSVVRWPPGEHWNG